MVFFFLRSRLDKTIGVRLIPAIDNIFLAGPMGPIHPVWGHVLVSHLPLNARGRAGFFPPHGGEIGKYNWPLPSYSFHQTADLPSNGLFPAPHPMPERLA